MTPKLPLVYHISVSSGGGGVFAGAEEVQTVRRDTALCDVASRELATGPLHGALEMDRSI